MEEDLYQEDLNSPLLRKQPTTSRTTLTTGISTGTPRKPLQQQAPLERRLWTPPAKKDIVTNGTVGSGYDTGYEGIPETHVAETYSTAGSDLPRTTDGWNDVPTAAHHHRPSVTSGIPQHAPRGQDTFRYQMDDKYNSNSSSRATIPVTEQIPVQSPISEQNENSHQHASSYHNAFESNVLQEAEYVNEYAQSHKESKKLKKGPSWLRSKN